MSMFFNTQEEALREAHSHLEEFCMSVTFTDIPCDKSSLHKKIVAVKSLITKKPYTLNWLVSTQFDAKLRGYLNNHDFDFIHFDTISLAPYKKICGNIPTSLDHHNIESHMLFRRAKKENNWLKKLYFWQEGKRLENFEKFYCPQFTFNFTCSEIDSKRLVSISPTSTTYTIPNGVDVNYFNPEPKIEKADRLIFAGTLSWYPNIEAVLFIANEIWPQLKKVMPNVHIDIIGAHPPKQLMELAKQDSHFHVYGFVNDIRPYFRAAKCYICPIKDGGGTKLKILDALSTGMAIIADEIACEGIEVSNEKDVIFATTGNEYIEAIISILSNDLQRKAMENNARELACDTYSYDMIGTQLSELFVKYANV